MMVFGGVYKVVENEVCFVGLLIIGFVFSISIFWFMEYVCVVKGGVYRWYFNVIGF